MRIPSSFKMMGHTIKVKKIAPEDWKDANESEPCLGIYEADKQTIRIKGVGGTLEGHIFYHELVHAIMTSLGHEFGKEIHNEQIVDSLAGLLHQAMTTAKFNAD